MACLIRKFGTNSVSFGFYRSFSLSSTNNKTYSCKLLIVGGGSGGCTIASKFSRRLGKDAVIVLEPSTDHYYQPLWTLVGAGVKTVADTRRPELSVLPAGAVWLKDRAKNIDADKMVVTTEQGDVINYEYVVIAVGVKNDYNKVGNLTEALLEPNSGVSTIYSPVYCEKTWRDLQRFKGGEAVFTFPQTAIKCPGAPQKIAYLADSYFTKTNIRSKANITYKTCLPVIFGVKKYADALLQVVQRKNINVDYRTYLKSIDIDKKEATFVSSEDASKESTVRYSMLHVTPPMSTPDFLRASVPALTDPAGYLTVDKYTLQHVNYTNVYGIGDCTDTPNSKTAAAVAKQCYVLEHNLLSTMSSDEPALRYDGYGACPLVTSYSTCILAEFLYDGVVHETFPFDQVKARESRLAYYMKRDLFPFIYWNVMLKGYYHGPEFVRSTCLPLAKLFNKI